ncbi:cellulase family glycosylhydrolase [Sphingomonas sp. dw_22]|uniref:cellulase family glycosylhydrolase n=1 Tax=Sphingomonas sp. dw_22 TaxID=2721175 RepID=UPI001BD48EF2|nr:cellulase family glycosylhydrolase [Sphingomonas sp. dw_22]
MKRALGVAAGMAAGLLALAPAGHAQDRGFLRAEGTRIVDSEGRPVLLRGMGLGGWMLQEGYMLDLGELEKGQQHVIRRHIAGAIGEKGADRFYRAWLDNFITKADIDAMARWGFNSVRLPMHYNLFTLPVEKEPVAGRDTWIESGFERVDRLLEWTRANGMFLILDLHAAPGGQGNDLPIADRDPSKPSLWDSAENRRKTVALWKRLAGRYADEPGIGAYDILNEPNWDFDGPVDGHGCKSTKNAQLWDFYRELIAAIRSVDKRHMIVIEGNCWGNNYGGQEKPLDANLTLSFHKYWNRNDAASIAPYLALRDRLGVPLWLGESGENSNVWFRDAIRLVEDQGIGWSWWPLKKIRYNNPLQVDANPGWDALVAWWLGKGPKPDAKAAEAALMRLAEHDVRFENNIFHPDVIDAMFRLPHADEARPFKANHVGAEAFAIAAVDYDLGPAGIAYADREDANYYVATGGERVTWNSGLTYRNDGVDVAREADGVPYVASFQTGEWMQYTLDLDRAGTRALTVTGRGRAGGTLSLSLNGGAPVTLTLLAGTGWQTLRVPAVKMLQGNNRLVLKAENCADCEVKGLEVAAAGS